MAREAVPAPPKRLAVVRVGQMPAASRTAVVLEPSPGHLGPMAVACLTTLTVNNGTSRGGVWVVTHQNPSLAEAFPLVASQREETLVPFRRVAYPSFQAFLARLQWDAKVRPRIDLVFRIAQ